MSVRNLLAALLLLVPAYGAAAPQGGHPREPLRVDAESARARATRPAPRAALIRSSAATNSVTVNDAVGDFLSFYLFDEPTPPPTGQTVTLEMPKFFLAGIASAPHVLVWFQVGSSYHEVELPWNPSGLTYSPPPPTSQVPIAITQVIIQDLGNSWRLTLTLEKPVPGSGEEWGFGFYGFGTGWDLIARADAWNSLGFGFQTSWRFPDEQAFATYRRPWHDLVSATLTQTDARTVVLELLAAEAFPSATSSALTDARFRLYFHDFEEQYTHMFLEVKATPSGWATWLITRTTGFWGEPVVELSAPVIEGNRLRVTVPLDPVPVRNEFKFSVATRLTLNTAIGDIFTTDIDSMPDSGLVAMTLTDPPEIVVSSFPGALMQTTAVAGATTAFTLTNAGDLETTITLAQQGDFFTVNPSVFPLAAGASQIVTVTGVSKPAGSYAGTIVPAGLGVPAGLTIPVRMLVTAPSGEGEAKAQPDENRVDLAAPSDQQQVAGETGFTNVGTGTLTGLVIPDVPWIVVAEPLITIQPNQNAKIHFTVDRSKRSDAHDPMGSAIGSLSLQYIAGSGAGAAAALVEALADGIQVSTTLVTVTDTARPRTTQGAPSPLRAGEIAIFLSSVGHALSPNGVFVSDVQVGSLQPLSNISLIYTPAGAPLSESRTVSLTTLSSAQPLGFADFTKTVFEQESGLGTLQIRGQNIEALNVSASVFNKSNHAGTYGSAIPALRSDRAIGAGERAFIPGVIGASSTGRTNFMVQETSGNDASIRIDLLDANGTVILTKPLTVPAFQHARENTLAPAGAVAAVITVDAGSAGRVLAYATPVDALSGDTWIVTDWPRVLGYSATQKQIIPIAGRILGANNNLFRTALAITNQAAAAASPIVRFVSNVGVITAKTVTIDPSHTATWGDLLHDLLGLDGGLGYLEIDPQGTPVSVTSRTFATIGDDPKTFGTDVPAVAAGGLSVGGIRRISGFDDADQATIVARSPATFRTNLGLVETQGKSATVRLTLHFRHPQGTRLVIVGSASRDIQLGPGQFLLLQNVSKEILGDYRQNLQGNLKNLFLEVEVIGGEGSVIGFTSSVDNGSADQLFKLE